MRPASAACAKLDAAANAGARSRSAMRTDTTARPKAGAHVLVPALVYVLGDPTRLADALPTETRKDLL